MNITTLGIDIAKNVFQLHGVDKDGKTVGSPADLQGLETLCHNGYNHKLTN